MDSVDRFTQKLRSVEGMYYRMDTGRNAGRNAESTQRTIDMRTRELDAILAAAVADESDPLPEYLDEHPKLAARYRMVSRRIVGLS